MDDRTGLIAPELALESTITLAEEESFKVRVRSCAERNAIDAVAETFAIRLADVEDDTTMVAAAPNLLTGIAVDVALTTI